MIQKYYDYLQKLLLLQFQASEDLDHNLSKGEIREDFLKDIIVKQFQNIICHKGIVIDDGFQSGQMDLIITSKKCSNINLGTHSMVYIDDVDMMVEIKSKGVKRYLDELEIEAKKIKERINIKNKNNGISVPKYPIIGVFAYKFDSSKETLLKKFGYTLKNGIYEKRGKINYSYIDFVIVLNFEENEEDLFLRRDILENNYTIIFGNALKNLFSIIEHYNN